MAEFLSDRWLPAVESTIRPSTFASYERNVRLYIEPRVGAVRLQSLTPDALNTMYGDLLESGGRSGRRLSKRTVRLAHATLHKALNDAVRWGYVIRNVSDFADPPKPPKPRPKSWKVSELSQFLEHARHHDPEYYALWRLAAATGMRRGELCGLRSRRP